MDDRQMLALCYQNQQFMAWVVEHQFCGITASNVNKYYSLYTRAKACEDRDCLTCPGLIPRWTTEDEIQRGVFQQIPCEVQRLAQRDLAGAAVRDRSVIPPVFQDATLSALAITDDSKKAITDYITQYPVNTPQGLYLYSAEHGVGRTTALWCIVKDLLRLKKIYTGYLLTTGPMFAEQLVRDANTTKDHPYFEQARTCDLLVIDDFGQEKYTSGYADKLNAILEDRYWQRRALVVSSTRTFAGWGWAEGVEQIIFSRLLKTTKPIRLDHLEDR